MGFTRADSHLLLEAFTKILQCSIHVFNSRVTKINNALSCYRGKTWALMLEVSDEGVVDGDAGSVQMSGLEVELGIAVVGEGKKWEVCCFAHWRRSG